MRNDVGHVRAKEDVGKKNGGQDRHRQTDDAPRPPAGRSAGPQSPPPDPASSAALTGRKLRIEQIEIAAQAGLTKPAPSPHRNAANSSAAGTADTRETWRTPGESNATASLSTKPKENGSGEAIHIWNNDRASATYVTILASPLGRRPPYRIRQPVAATRRSVPTRDFILSHD